MASNNDFKDYIPHFMKAIESSNMSFDIKQIDRFYKSLLTKPFLILTGNSGTGKTKLAKLFCRYISGSKSNRKNILLDRVLKANEFREKYLLVRKNDLYIEIINKNGDSGKKIPLPKDAIFEWYKALQDGTLTVNSDAKIEKKKVHNSSEYQDHIHGFYSNLFDIAKYMLKLENILGSNTSPITPSYTILPVGADWTDNRPILGYYNPLTKTYQSTPALDLILNAMDEPERPFFLILDEMNLSHVERYFADLLSAMESGESVPLHAEEKEVESSSGKNIPSNLTIPNNLFVIGTVNVDETTYMFSPKVLDRANVIEFKVGVDEFEQFLESGGGAVDEIEPAPVGSAEGFLALARELRQGSSSIEELSAEEMTTVKNCLKDLFGILAFTGSEFAYRTAGEIMRYVKLSRHMADEVGKWTPEVALDEQILQKVLPKLHGSRRQIEPLLKALAKYCLKPNSNELSDIDGYFENAREFSVNLQTGNIAYPESFAKLKEMVNTVERDQFVSFIR